MDTEKKDQKSCIDENSKDKIRKALDHITDEVSIQAFLLPECKLSEKIKTFLDELTDITDKIHIDIKMKDEDPGLEAKLEVGLFPFIALIDKTGEYTRIGYHGVPSGYELDAFIAAVTDIAAPDLTIAEPLMERINNLKTPMNLKIGISLTCVRCPELVMSCQQLALLNNGITAEMLDLNHFPDLAKKFRIMSIPALIINDDRVKFGGKTLEELVSDLEQ